MERGIGLARGRLRAIVLRRDERMAEEQIVVTDIFIVALHVLRIALATAAEYGSRFRERQQGYVEKVGRPSHQPESGFGPKAISVTPLLKIREGARRHECGASPFSSLRHHKGQRIAQLRFLLHVVEMSKL